VGPVWALADGEELESGRAGSGRVTGWETWRWVKSGEKAESFPERRASVGGRGKGKTRSSGSIPRKERLKKAPVL